MNDVARSAGVSLKTVSRVVNGETTVDPALAARVRAAIAALGYRPHLGASLLRRHDRRTGTIGVLLDDLGDPFTAAVHRAIEDEGRQRGVVLLSGSVGGDPARERDLAAAYARRHVDGLVLAPVAPNQGHLAREDTPVVFVGRPGHGHPGDTVVTADRSGAAAAVWHLVAHGHRRIAYLRERTSGADRRRGYRDAMREAGLPTCEADGGLVAAVLGLPGPPTALLTAGERVTIATVRALRELGVSRRIALVGLDDVARADLLEPAITVVARDPAAIGRAAARALFERMDGGTKEPRVISLPTELIIRGSGEVLPTGS
ncbi:LacI family DNA-binding transcriptional regulator [Actinoplanes sp. NPDC051494]|uniref:LacI family DNA-binding transcriptional regulator n=1 Tax=Actinoplanes sp. NPDC051494 TaxID=3363907 RepID=UPI00379B511D